MKEPSYKKTRESAINWMGNMLPKALGGNVVKAKHKRKKQLKDVMMKKKKSGY